MASIVSNPMIHHRGMLENTKECFNDVCKLIKCKVAGFIHSETLHFYMKIPFVENEFFSQVI